MAGETALAAQSPVVVTAKTGSTVDVSPPTESNDEDDADTSLDDQDATLIRLEGDSISVTGDGATVDGSVVTITAAGTYNLSGALNDGQVIVKAGDEDKVTLVLNGVSIASNDDMKITGGGSDNSSFTLAGGAVLLASGDDGINVAGGNDGSSISGRPGQNEFAPSDAYRLVINGGYVVVDAGGGRPGGGPPPGDRARP